MTDKIRLQPHESSAGSLVRHPSNGVSQMLRNLVIPNSARVFSKTVQASHRLSERRQKCRRGGLQNSLALTNTLRNDFGLREDLPITFRLVTHIVIPASANPREPATVYYPVQRRPDKMRAFVLSMICATALGAVTATRTTAQESASGCMFAISPAVTAPEVVGDNEAASRALVMTQPDSPLRIIRVDLSGIDVKAGAGWFTRFGRHVMDVQNVSEQVISDARVMVDVGFSSKGGVGSGMKLRRSLKPGEHARIEWNGGPGRGNIGSGAEVLVVALVEEVQTADCTYRPSQAWPNPPTPHL